MQVYITEGWTLFCIAFGIILLTSFIMKRQSMYFYTRDVVYRKFSIIDLELPASAQELSDIIKGIYKLPANIQARSIRSLKAQLYTDFIFMPAAYGAIFLLCMKVSLKMSSLGPIIFSTLAWLQIISFVLDIFENIYLLNKIRPDVEAARQSVHKTFQLMEILKWGIPLVATVCSISAVIYFWFVGKFNIESLKYAAIISGEIILFFLAGKILKSTANVVEE